MTALAEPVWRRPQRVVLVLDGTASMTAKNASGQTRFEEAADKARELVGNMGYVDSMAVLVAGDGIRIHSRMSHDRLQILATLDADALPVLAWGVGKWLFSRARVVDSLLRRWPAEELALGDTSLRPTFWPTPGPMAEGATLGRRVLRGSDPLPRAFEETRAGQYGDLADDVLPSDRPLLSKILSVLRDDDLRPAGRRAGPLQFVRRMA